MASLSEALRRVKQNQMPKPRLCYNPRVFLKVRPAARRRSLAISVSSVLWLACVIAVSATQDPEPPKPASSGIYTAAQAERGKNVFASICTGCHTAAQQSGDTFAKKWNGATMADLYTVLADEMPKDDPGSLSEKDRGDVMAYLLKINGMAAGGKELTTEVEQLKKIVIDIK